MNELHLQVQAEIDFMNSETTDEVFKQKYELLKIFNQFGHFIYRN